MNPPDLRIVPLQADQAQTLADLARLVWQRHYPSIISQAQIDYMLHQRYRPETIRQQISQPGGWWDAAYTQTGMIGFCHTFPDSGPHRVKLDKLYVHPDHQRHGIGAALLAQVEIRARAHSRSVIRLHANKHNQVALAAYRKYGFSIAGEVITAIGGGFVMDDYVLEKSLR